MAKGRPNKGLAHLDKHDVSELSRIRSRIVLQTVMGELSVHEACERLGIDRSRFARLRDDALRQYQEAFEPGSPGRPVERDVEADAREQELRDRIAQLERELREAGAVTVRSGTAPEVAAQLSGRTLVCGSLYLVGEMLAALGLECGPIYVEPE